MSYKTHYFQNTLNSITVYIALIIYIIYLISCFVINSLELAEENNKLNIISESNFVNVNAKIDFNQKNYENINKEDMNENKEISIQEFNKEIDKNENFNHRIEYNSNYYFLNNFIFLKLCLVQGIFWLSEETEKIYLFLNLIFLELSAHMNNYLYQNIFNMNRDNQNLTEFNGKTKKISLISFIFYIIIQKITINMNQIFFLMIVHSYDINSARQQQVKFIKISLDLGLIISYISNFKFSFLTLGYYFEKNYFSNKDNKKSIKFSIFFIIKRIIINLKLNNSAILLVYHSLIKMKDEQLWNFCTYYLEDFIVFLFDYLFVIVSLIIFKILN